MGFLQSLRGCVSPFVRVSALLVTMMCLSLGAARAANVSVDCSGGTPGAFTSLQAAIDSLDLVGPHHIAMVGGPQECFENVRIIDRQRLTIESPGGIFIVSAAGPRANVLTISGSTGIVVILMGFRGGFNGVRIDRASEVSLLGCTIETNRNRGILAVENSTVRFDGAIRDNGRVGISLDSSRLNATGTIIENNGRRGVDVGNGSSAVLVGPNTIQNNGRIGVNVGLGSTVDLEGDVADDGTPLPNIIEGHSLIGLNTTGSHVILAGPNKIRNNGFSGGQFHAGVRSDDNTIIVALGDGDIEITNNTGPGIEATIGGALDLSGTFITNNTEDGIRLLGNSQVGFFPPNTNVLAGNGGESIACDGTSVFFGDRTGVKDIECRISELKAQPSWSGRRRMMEEEKESQRSRRDRNPE